MNKLIVLGIVLLPCLAHAAASDCKVVEFADHYELMCVGDGKIVPAPLQQTVDSPPAVTAPLSPPQTVATPSGAAASDSSSTAAQTDASPKPVVHRQGRPPKAVMDAARAMRYQAIQERLQQQQQQ